MVNKAGIIPHGIYGLMEDIGRTGSLEMNECHHERCTLRAWKRHPSQTWKTAGCLLEKKTKTKHNIVFEGDKG